MNIWIIFSFLSERHSICVIQVEQKWNFSFQSVKVQRTRNPEFKKGIGIRIGRRLSIAYRFFFIYVDEHRVTNPGSVIIYIP